MAGSSENVDQLIDNSVNENTVMQDVPSIESTISTLYEPDTKNLIANKTLSAESIDIVEDTDIDTELREALGLSKEKKRSFKVPTVFQKKSEENLKNNSIASPDPDIEYNYFDLTTENLNIFGEPRLPLGPAISISTHGSEEEKENAYEESYDDQAFIGYKPERKSEFDRNLYIREFVTLENKKRKLFLVNSILHKGLSDYFIKKKIELVYDESVTNDYELTEKYEGNIDELYDARENWVREKDILENDIKDLTVIKKENLELFQRNFNRLLHREKEVGSLLVDGNTGKKVSKEVYERLINRQKQKTEVISEVRLIYLKKRESIKDIEEKLKHIEIFDGYFNFIDFEQIQMEINTYRDKIEEREDELRRLRDRLSYAVQLASHIREKLNVIIIEIEHKKTLVAEREQRIGELRERVNYLKTTRNSNRIKIKKLSINAGMLKFPKLLRDLDVTEEEKNNLAKELDKLKKHTKEFQVKLKAIRIVIETLHMQMKQDLEMGDHHRNQRESDFYGDHEVTII